MQFFNPWNARFFKSGMYTYNILVIFLSARYFSVRLKGIRNNGGIGAGCRRIEQYNDERLTHMLAVGTAPGAGNRSHIADVLACVDNEIRRV